jgi:hypothetical protein
LGKCQEIDIGHAKLSRVQGKCQEIDIGHVKLSKVWENAKKLILGMQSFHGSEEMP